MSVKDQNNDLPKWLRYVLEKWKSLEDERLKSAFRKESADQI